MRHGETDWNRQHIYMGQTDIPLNKTGEDQSFSAATLLENEDIKHIVTSPLVRAQKTAEIINKKLDVPITILDRLKECSFGNSEGQAHDDGVLIQKWMDGEHPDGGESIMEFEKRVMDGVNEALKINENVLIVSHGGVYACLSRLMKWPIINLKNCETIFHRPPSNPSHPWLICQLQK